MKPLISRNPDICSGKPCFSGTRIPVYILLERLEAGESTQKILKGYPSLRKQHVQAALHYAAETLKNQEYFSIA
jgi:uncharacterized protein (DUF433 family)